MERFNFDNAIPWLVSLLPNIIGGIVTLIIGLIIANIVTNIVKKMLLRSSIDEIVVPFLGSFISVGSKIMVLLATVAWFGIQSPSFAVIFIVAAFVSFIGNIKITGN